MGTEVCSRVPRVKGTQFDGSGAGIVSTVKSGFSFSHSTTYKARKSRHSPIKWRPWPSTAASRALQAKEREAEMRSQSLLWRILATNMQKDNIAKWGRVQKRHCINEEN